MQMLEQLSLFNLPESQTAICCFDGRQYPTRPLEAWMQALVPSGEYLIDIGEHYMVLRPVAISVESIRPGHHFYHFTIGTQLYSGVFVGREQ